MYSFSRVICIESDLVRLVGGSGHCSGTLEMKHLGEWRPVVPHFPHWNLKTSAVVCRQLDCGSTVSALTKIKRHSEHLPTWRFQSSCNGSESSLGECGIIESDDSVSRLELICSGNTNNFILVF